MLKHAACCFDLINKANIAHTQSVCVDVFGLAGSFAGL